MLLERRRRHLERYIEIGRVLARHGWDHILGRLGLADIFHVKHRALGTPPGPVQVRESIEELGPTFIKLGQLLSTRPDIIPKDYTDELEKLQDEVPPVSFHSIRQVIEEEFGMPVDGVFAAFDPKPLASASLGQTYLATLFDGQHVVVKVQRPGIRQTIETDLEIMAGVAHFLEQHFEQARIYGLSELVEEFSISIRQEMDYTREGRNGDKLLESFAGVGAVKIAATIWDYTTVRVLTQERLIGIKISDIPALDAGGYDRVAIARNLSRAFLKMVFVDGFFHSDPHPGNLVVLKDNVVGFVDYGQMGRLNATLKMQVTRLLSDYIQEDSEGFAETLLDIGTSTSDLNRHAYGREIDQLLRQWYDVPVSQVRIGDILRRTMQISARYRVRLPANMAMLMKATIEIESTDSLLDPNYNLTQDAREYIERSIRSEFSTRKIKTQLLENLLAWKDLFINFPHRGAEVLENMAENRFRVIFRHEGLEAPAEDIDQSANRLSFALIVSSIIIGSSLVLSSRIGPAWHGFPVLGLIGYGIALILGAALLISIIRGGKLW